MNDSRRITSPAVFLLVAAAVYTAAFYVRGVFAIGDSPEILAAALAVDMVVLVPTAYYFLIVRRFKLPAVSVAGVVVMSLIAATLIIPSERVIAPLKIVAVILEVGVLGVIAWKAARGIRRFRAAAAKQTDDDAFNAISAAARMVIGSGLVAKILAYELAVMYYGLFSWRTQPIEGPGRFTSYKHNSYGSTLFGISVLLVVELIAVHLIVQRYWGATGAWVLSILTAYTGIWLMSEWHAHRLRPMLITSDALVLRAGVRWEVEIPVAQIESFRRVSGMENTPRGALNLVSFGDAFFEVTTTAPVEVHGVYGMRRSVTCIWFTVDDPAGFREMLSSRLR